MRAVHAEYAERTLAAYSVYADAAIASWQQMLSPAPLLRQFAAAVPVGGQVLDYGCGIGTDLAWLAARGFQAEGIDGTVAFVDVARRHCPSARISHATFDVVRLGAEQYDGVWCSAALMHVPPPVLRLQLTKLHAALRSGGVLGLSLAWGRTQQISTDWIPGRYMAAYTKPRVQALFADWTVSEIRVAADTGRSGRWVQVLATRQGT